MLFLIIYIFFKFRFDHRKDIDPYSNTNQNDLFIRRDIVKKLNVVQL